MILFFEIVLIFYCLMMMLVLYALLKSARPQPKNLNEKPISILIPFKNEAINLDLLLATLLDLSYTNYEVIFVDDHSSDGGTLIIQNFITKHQLSNIQIIHQDNMKSGKKNAIIKAVSVAKYDFCVQTDADCRVPKDWLSDYNHCFDAADLVLGNVIGSSDNNSFRYAFQEIEFYMLQGIKRASAFYGVPLLATGASIGYKKAVFLKIKPFEDNEHIVSGDDMFMLQKFKEAHCIVKSINSSNPVQTQLLPTWKAVINQRTRWAAKTPKLKSLPLNVLGFITLLINMITIASLLLFFIYAHFIFLFIVLSKFFVEFLVLFLLVFRQNRLKLLIYTPIMIIAYPIVLISILINGLFYKNSW